MRSLKAASLFLAQPVILLKEYSIVLGYQILVRIHLGPTFRKFTHMKKKLNKPLAYVSKRAKPGSLDRITLVSLSFSLKASCRSTLWALSFSVLTENGEGVPKQGSEPGNLH